MVIAEVEIAIFSVETTSVVSSALLEGPPEKVSVIGRIDGLEKS